MKLVYIDPHHFVYTQNIKSSKYIHLTKNSSTPHKIMKEIIQNNTFFILTTKETNLMMPLYFIFPIFIFFFFTISRLNKKNFPPGPKGWPIIGNMMMMDQLTHHGLAKLAKKYGGILHLQMGYLQMTVVSSPAEAREVLQLQDTIFANRPTTIAVEYLSYARADMAFANYGPFWRQMRKLCVMKLFSRKRAESWDSIRDEVESMTMAVATRVGSSVNIGELVFGVAKNIIYR